ncbi:MAG: GNAT family N-acetyltransferase [Thermoanaerobaculia bacterium]
MTGSAIAVRRGGFRDIPYLRPIERAATLRFREHEAFEAFWALDFSQALFAQKIAEGALWVATLGPDAADPGDDEPVGFAFTTVIDGIAHLDEIDVHPGASGRGVGSALLERVADVARDEGYPAITLSTLEDVPWNAPYYERRGFRILAAEELTPGLRDLLAHEAECGFPMHLRVIMRREL